MRPFEGVGLGGRERLRLLVLPPTGDFGTYSGGPADTIVTSGSSGPRLPGAWTRPAFDRDLKALEQPEEARVPGAFLRQSGLTVATRAHAASLRLHLQVGHCADNEDLEQRAPAGRREQGCDRELNQVPAAMGVVKGDPGIIGIGDVDHCSA